MTGTLAGLLTAAALALPVGCAHGQHQAPPTDQESAADARAGIVRSEAPASGLGGYLAARHAEAQGDTAAAARYYREALTDDPDNTALLRRAYFFSAVEGDLTVAADLARRLLALDPQASIAPLVVAVDMVAANRWAEARSLLTPRTRQGLNGFLVPVILAWMAVEAGDTDAAMAALTELESNPGYQALGRLNAALILDLAGDGDRAVAAANAYLDASDQPSLRGIQMAGGILLRHAPDGARRLADLLAEYQSRFPDSLLLDNARQALQGPLPPEPLITRPAQGLADLFYGTASLLADNDSQTASLFVRMALHLEPSFRLAQLLLGQVLAGQDRHADALALFDTVAATPGLELVAGLAKAESLVATDETEAAITTLTQLAAAWPAHTAPLIELGDLLRRKERFAEAADAYTRALDRLDTPEPRHWPLFFGRGVCFERTKAWDKAEADFRKALALSPDQPFVLNYLGYSWVDQGLNIAEAKAMIERAESQRPKDGYIIDSLGWAHYRLGEFDEAVHHLERAVHEAPDDATINDHLGDAYWQVGRRLEARFQWQRALSLIEDDPDLAATITDKLANGLPKPD